jgi:hypothetical protein
MTSPTRTAILLVFILVSTAPPGDAQAPFEIGGVVTDETGGLIAGASVTLKDARGGVQASTSTNQEGRYRLVATSPGKTTLTVQKAGFAPASRTVSVAATGSATIDVKLRVAITERVDVRSGLVRVSLDSDQNLSGIRLSDKILEALPDDPDSLLQALRLLAATTGTRADLVTFYVDGMPLIKRLPPKDVIQSVRINANPFSAEFAEPGASRVEILTKPASQHFHGNGRVDFNDEKLNARNLFEPAGASYQTRTYEGYIGGPVVPNRWGFLAYGGRWEQDDNVVVNATPIDPVTLETQELQLNVGAPTRTTSYSLKSDARLTRNHTVAVEYGENEQTRRNAGLQSGFDLPERAYSGDAKEQTASVWVTSTFRAALNEFRARATRIQMIDRAVTTTPAIVVLEAFNAGGNQDALFRENNTETVRLTNVFTYGTQTHSIRVGGQAEVVRLEQVDRANFNGTFVFGSDVVRDGFGNPVLSATGEPSVISSLDLYRLTLAGVPGYRPSQFSIVGGDPGVTFSVVEGAWFAQDDWRVAPRLTISYGVRHEYQQQGNALRMQLAPRATIAWAPSENGDSAVRGGVGLFYTQIPHGLFSDVLRLDGRHGQRLVVDRPAFFPGVPGTLPGAQHHIAIRTQAPDLTFPSMLVSTISYDRRLAGSLFGSIGYTWRRGANLLRTRNIGVPAGAGAAAPADALILRFESTGRSSAHDINATVSGNIGPNVTVFGSYGWTRALQDTDDLYSVPADSSNLAAEWGVAAVPRHRAAFGGTIFLPDDFAVYPFVTLTSELPFNITTGGDINHDSVFTDRPALADAGHAGAVATPFGVFNLTPGPGEAVIPRNFGIGPTQFTFDVTATKTFFSYNGPIPSSRRTTIQVSVTNLLNNTNYAPFNGVLTSPFFGSANRALNKRRVTLSVRYDF